MTRYFDEKKNYKYYIVVLTFSYGVCDPETKFKVIGRNTWTYGIRGMPIRSYLIITAFKMIYVELNIVIIIIILNK